MRVTVVGAGVSGLTTAYALVDGIEVTAIADVNSEAVKSTATAFGIAGTFSDHDSLFNSGAIDAVHIAVPPAHSPDITEAAVDAGLHVISEKPVATSVERARDIAEKARQAGVVTAVDHEMRYDPIIGKVRQLVADGFIGEPRLLNINVVMSVGIDPAMRAGSRSSKKPGS